MSVPSAQRYMPQHYGRFMKLAEQEAKPAERRKGGVGSILKPWAQGTAGMALGTLAGYTGMKGADYALRRMGKPGITQKHLGWIVPAASAGLGATYSLWKAQEREAMRRALENSRD